MGSCRWLVPSCRRADEGSIGKVAAVPAPDDSVRLGMLERSQPVRSYLVLSVVKRVPGSGQPSRSNQRSAPGEPTSCCLVSLLLLFLSIVLPVSRWNREAKQVRAERGL